jgi:hypothetical protein
MENSGAKYIFKNTQLNTKKLKKHGKQDMP